MEKVIIAAIARNGVIGKNNTLPWKKIPGDQKKFRDLTIGHPVVMGRRTADSLKKALSARHNIVLTRENYYRDNFDVSTLEDLFDNLNNKNFRKGHIDYSKMYIIGGGEIYGKMLSLADSMEITLIEDEYDGNIFFPCQTFYSRDWNIKNEEQRNGYKFISYVRSKW